MIDNGDEWDGISGPYWNGSLIPSREVGEMMKTPELSLSVGDLVRIKGHANPHAWGIIIKIYEETGGWNYGEACLVHWSEPFAILNNKTRKHTRGSWRISHERLIKIEGHKK